MDREHIGAETVGTIFISTDDIVTGEPVEGWWDLMVNNKGDVHGQVHIMFQLFPVGSLSVGKMLSEAYFEPREGCKMTIYQDADTPDLDVFHGVAEPDGSPYKPTRLWMDLYQSLEEAQKLIYVTGWSVFTGISLVRGYMNKLSMNYRDAKGRIWAFELRSIMQGERYYNYILLTYR